MRDSRSTRIDLWANFWWSLIAVVVGNAIYFLLVAPHMPESVRHHRFAIDVGLVVDFWVCLVVYGLLLPFRKKRRKNLRE